MMKPIKAKDIRAGACIVAVDSWNDRGMIKFVTSVPHFNVAAVYFDGVSYTFYAPHEQKRDFKIRAVPTTDIWVVT